MDITDMQGANMMAPGLLSPGGDLPDGLEKDAIVAIHAEGKDTACGIGKMAESSEAIKKAGKGVAIEVICWIGYVHLLFRLSNSLDCIKRESGGSNPSYTENGPGLPYEPEFSGAVDRFQNHLGHR
jgi:hypothetical protein